LYPVDWAVAIPILIVTGLHRIGPPVPSQAPAQETDVTVTEQARHRLHAHLEEIVGEEHAAALMEWLPDGPIASKADVETGLAHLREVMDLRFEQAAATADLRWEQTATKSDLHDLRTEMYKGFTRQTWGLVTAVSLVNGLMLAALRLV
jgi:hypothetical protein